MTNTAITSPQLNYGMSYCHKVNKKLSHIIIMSSIFALTFIMFIIFYNTITIPAIHVTIIMFLTILFIALGYNLLMYTVEYKETYYQKFENSKNNYVATIFKPYIEQKYDCYISTPQAIALYNGNQIEILKRTENKKYYVSCPATEQLQLQALNDHSDDKIIVTLKMKEKY